MSFIKWAFTIVIFAITSCLLTVSVNSQAVTFSVGVVDPSIEFLGYSSPNSFISFVENSSIIGTTTADSNGYYYKIFPAYSVGIHTISMYSTDINNNNTPNFSYDIVVLPTQITSISFDFPPTLVLPKANFENEDILVTGLAKPNSNITIKLDGSGIQEFEVTSNSLGQFSFTISKVNLANGNFFLSAYLSDSVDQSVGNTVNFTYTPPGQGTNFPTNTSSDNGDIIEAIDLVLKRDFSWRALGEILGIDELENMLGVNQQQSFIPSGLLFFSWGFILAIFTILALIFFLNSSGSKRKNKPKTI